jgi:hypothetical protein
MSQEPEGECRAPRGRIQEGRKRSPEVRQNYGHARPRCSLFLKPGTAGSNRRGEIYWLDAIRAERYSLECDCNQCWSGR